MTILITGVAGFIGAACTKALLRRGEQIIGLDNLNAYYDPKLKKARLKQFSKHPNFVFLQRDVGNRDAILKLAQEFPTIDCVLHLAAQAGVRHSLHDPYAYLHSNILGQLNILELCRQCQDFRHLVYASSSSVYGANDRLPFSTDDRTDTPISFYAVSKRTNELMGHYYAHLYQLPQTGLRFFTVYGPWGRPDMALFIFTKKILNGEKLAVFNHGEMLRDFTYIDDIVTGVIKVMDHPPVASTSPPLATNQAKRDHHAHKSAPHRLFNIGNDSPVKIGEVINILEKALDRKAIIDFQPLQPGDVEATHADITPMAETFDFLPKTQIKDGIAAFVAWYQDFYKIKL